jgi:hypothetical protein
MLSDERLAEIRALLAAATPGPLHYVEGGCSALHQGLYGTHDPAWMSPGEISDVRKDRSVWTVSRRLDMDGWNTDGGTGGYGPSEADAALWAESPTAIAELLAEVDRLRAALLRYGMHASTCPHAIASLVRGPCSCGFFAALGDRSTVDGT